MAGMSVSMVVVLAIIEISATHTSCDFKSKASSEDSTISEIAVDVKEVSKS